MQEQDLYPPVRDWFSSRGCEVKGEVGHLDVMAISGELVLAAELKLTLNLDVVLQAVKRQRVADAVWIAVPKKGKTLASKRWQDICHLLRRLELGLLLVTLRDHKALVEEVIAPQPFAREISQGVARARRRELVAEFNSRHGDYNPGGTSKRKLVTAYKEQAIQIAVILAKQGPLSIGALKEQGTDPQKTAAILQDNHYRWFERVGRGIYQITATGQRELEQFQELVRLYSP